MCIFAASNKLINLHCYANSIINPKHKEMNNLQNFQNTLFESTWVDLQEIKRIMAERTAETDRQLKETDRMAKENWLQMKETDRQMKETDRQMKETDRQMKETDRRMKVLQKTVGEWSNNHGSFAEEYFFNSFENGKQNFFGEKFDEISKNLKPKKKDLADEYDIVLFNSDAVAIIEVKFKAHKNDLLRVLNKAKTFRILCSDYKDYRIYLGLASLNFYPELEQECIEHGVAVIKQVGDTVIINDERLAVF